MCTSCRGEGGGGGHYVFGEEMVVKSIDSCLRKGLVCVEVSQLSRPSASPGQLGVGCAAHVGTLGVR